MIDAPTAPTPAAVVDAPAVSDVVIPPITEVVEDTPAAVEPPSEFSSKFAALARKEKFLRQQQDALKAEQEKIKAQQEKYGSYETARERAKTDPIAYLEAAGLSYSEITDYLLTKGEKPSTDAEIKRLEALIEQERLDRRQGAEAAEREQQERIVASYKNQIKDTVAEHSEKYELIQAHEAYDVVYGVVENYYESTGKIIELEKALEHVETELENQARRLLQLKRFAPKIEAPTEDETPPPSSPVVAAPPTRTLTNAQTAAAPPTTSEWLSDDESKRRAAALIRWT